MPFINDRLEQNQTVFEEATSYVSDAGNNRIRSRFLFEHEAVMQQLRANIVGQEKALRAMGDMLKVVKADIGDPSRPLAVSLFIGPMGVGKTEVVRIIAKAIHGRSDAFCRIDMNTLAQEHYAAALIGAPPGYAGSKEGMTLLDIDAIQGSSSRPGIILFDELEKASREVVRALLNVLDNGRLTLASGNKQVDFRKTFIFMTSNVGALEVWAYRQRFICGWRSWLGRKPMREGRVLDQALHHRFEPEFLNRIDRVVTFEHIGHEYTQSLLDIELSKFNQRLTRHGRTLRVEATARQALCQEHDVRFGARDLARQVWVQLEPAIADYLLREPESKELLAVYDNNTITMRADL